MQQHSGKISSNEHQTGTALQQQQVNKSQHHSGSYGLACSQVLVGIQQPVTGFPSHTVFPLWIISQDFFFYQSFVQVDHNAVTMLRVPMTHIYKRISIDGIRLQHAVTT